MGGYLSDHEAAQFLGVEVEHLVHFDIHKCPEGWHVDQLKAYCNKHKLPVGNWYNSIAITSEELEGVISCSSIEEGLFRANENTRVFILDSKEAHKVWDLLKETNVFVVAVGDAVDTCHIHFESWHKAAVDSARMFYGPQ